jgi:hypothetical protein
MSNWKEIKQEVIVPKKEEKIDKNINKTENIEKKCKKESTIKDNTTTIVQEKKHSIEYIYNDLREEINKKDNIIQGLSMKLWRAEEIAKNSISLIEFKKSQFLLEESRWYLNKEVEQLNKYRKWLKKKLRYEKKTNYILLIFTIILFITMVVVWFSKV